MLVVVDNALLSCLIAFLSLLQFSNVTVILLTPCQYNAQVCAQLNVRAIRA